MSEEKKLDYSFQIELEKKCFALSAIGISPTLIVAGSNITKCYPSQMAFSQATTITKSPFMHIYFGGFNLKLLILEEKEMADFCEVYGNETLAA